MKRAGSLERADWLFFRPKPFMVLLVMQQMDIKKKCNAWRNGEFFFKTDWSILSQMEGENYDPYESHHLHKVEEKFIEKYFKK